VDSSARAPVSQIRAMVEMRSFYTQRLKIDERELLTMPWHEVWE
jgi:hypothetical protein